MGAWSDFDHNKTGMKFPEKQPNVDLQKAKKKKEVEKSNGPKLPHVGAFNKRASAIKSNKNLHLLNDDFLNDNHSVNLCDLVDKTTKNNTAKYMKNVEIINNQIKKRWETVNLPKDLVL